MKRYQACTTVVASSSRSISFEVRLGISGVQDHRGQGYQGPMHAQ